MHDYLHDIPKETLTKNHIKQDIIEMQKINISAVIILMICSLLFLIAAKGLWVYEKVAGVLFGICALLLFLIGIEMLFMPLIGRKIVNKNLIIVEDWLVGIREDTNYVSRYHQPYYEFCFAKGGRYRLYTNICGNNNYKWSKMYNMSNQGIYNYSRIDDEFYLVFSNQKKTNLLLIYNKKLFELKEN